MTTYNISELTVTRAKLNAFPNQYPSHAPFTQKEVESAKVVEVHFSQDLYAVVGTCNTGDMGVEAHRLTKKGTLDKKQGSTFFYFSQIVAIYCENVSESNSFLQDKKSELIVEKVEEIKGGIIKQLELKLNKILEIAKDFNYTDLKVHNISHYLYNAVKKGLITEGEEVELFRFIIEREYEYFQEWEEENLSHVKREYINRTSSFYYSCNFDNYLFEEILEGKYNSLSLEDFAEDLERDIYELLFNEHNKENIENIISGYDEEEQCFESYLDEFLEEGIETLENLLDELDTLLDAVLEAKKAYDYLSEYKEKENEYSIAEHYLEYEIAEYYAEEKAEKIFDSIVSEHKPLNKVTNMSVEKVVLDTKESVYGIKVTTNLKEHTVDLGLLEHELSEHFVRCVLFELTSLIDNSFDF